MEEGASGNPAGENDGARDPDSRDTGKRDPSPEPGGSEKAPENNVTDLKDNGSKEMEAEETSEAANAGSEDHPGRDKAVHVSSPRSSHKEREEGMTPRSPERGSDITSLDGLTDLSSQGTTEELMSSTASSKGYPAILGRVRRENSALYQLSREALDTIAADMYEKPLGISVSMQTDASWLYDHVYKEKLAEEKNKKLPPENDVYAVVSPDLSCLDVLYDSEFQEDFLKLFKESLRTLSSVGPPTVLAFRPESSRAGIHIELEKDYPETCEFCGSEMRRFPSFESLEKIAEYGHLFCCQKCRDLHEFIVIEKNRYRKSVDVLDISPHKAHGTEAEREKARERARQRRKERQMAKQFVYMTTEEEKEVVPIHTFDYNRQLHTISYCLSQERPSLSGWTKIPLEATEEPVSEEITYSVSSCDFTIAGGKLLKNQFLQQYYKNCVKFLTIFPDGTAQIFYPSGNLAIIVVQRNKDTGYVCIVQEDKSENAAIQAVLESCGNVTCYHPNGIIWINITVRGGHYSDELGNKVKTWSWPNNLQKYTPRVSFKPVFLSLNQNVGVRILAQDKIAISFLAMGKQARINVGTKVKPLAEHHPWPKYVSEDDLLLFALRIKILRIFAKFHGYLDFPAKDHWTKLQLPSYLLKWTMKLLCLCKECEISSTLDSLITEIVNSPA